MNKIKLGKGEHASREEGMCAMEFVAWVANEPHTDAPKCVDPEVANLMIELNDGLPDGRRSILKPYLGRCIGTRDDGRREERRRVYFKYAPVGGWSWMAAKSFIESDDAIKQFLEEVLPTEELPEVTVAIREKVGTAA